MGSGIGYWESKTVEQTVKLIRAEKRIAELEVQLADEKQTWRCFHCGFETSDRKEASGHFGEFGEEYPLCIHWSDLDADGKASEFQSINAELEGEREENLKLRQQVEQLEYLTGSQEAAISSRFKGCRTINEAFFKYDSMEGRALAAEERIAALEAALQVAREALENYPTLDANKMADLAVSDWQKNEHNLMATFKSHLRAFSLKAEQYRKQALAALDGEVKA